MILIAYLFETLLAFSIAFAATEDFTSRKVTADLFSIENPQKLLFKFERVPLQEGPLLKGLRTFTDPQGKVVAVEEYFYESGKVKKMNLSIKQTGESGSFEIKEGKIFFSYTVDGKTKTDDEKLEEPLLVADLMAQFIHNNWETLAKGEAMKFRLPVPSRLETVGFKFQKDGEDTYEGKPVDLVKMSPSSSFIAMLVKPIYFSVERAPTRQVLKVVGRTTPKIQKDGKWADLDVISVFKQEPFDSLKPVSDSKPVKK